MNRRYILITAARNEEEFIEATIKSVISQTIKPTHWFIVNDNSTDNTGKIIKKFADIYSFINPVNLTTQTKRDFASKVFGLNLVLDRIQNSSYDFIGILDADITFQSNYYETILNEFNKDPNLGVAGGEFFDIVDGKKYRVIKSPNSVRGGIQLFRRECFEQIGKFTPLKNGGEDIITEVTARKNGWKVKSFEHQMLDHHRLTGTGGWHIYEAKFREGILAYSMGYHPLFQIVKSIYRFKERPYIISGLLHLSGFLWANLVRKERVVNNDFIAFLRKEQLGRILSISR